MEGFIKEWSESDSPDELLLLIEQIVKVMSRFYEIPHSIRSELAKDSEFGDAAKSIGNFKNFRKIPKREKELFLVSEAMRRSKMADGRMPSWVEFSFYLSLAEGGQDHAHAALIELYKNLLRQDDDVPPELQEFIDGVFDRGKVRDVGQTHQEFLPMEATLRVRHLMEDEGENYADAVEKVAGQINKSPGSIKQYYSKIRNTPEKPEMRSPSGFWRRFSEAGVNTCPTRLALGARFLRWLMYADSLDED